MAKYKGPVQVINHLKSSLKNLEKEITSIVKIISLLAKTMVLSKG